MSNNSLPKIFIMNFQEEMEKISSIIYQYSTDIRLREFTVNLLGNHSYIKGGDYEVARNLFLYVKKNIRYVSDIYNIETIQDPITTIRIKFGDCDDFVVLLGSMLKSIGFNVALVSVALNDSMLGTGSNPDNDFNHIFLMVETTRGWIFADPANKSPEADFGWAVAPEYYNKRYILEVR